MKVGVRHQGSSGKGGSAPQTLFSLVLNESCATPAQTVFANLGEKKDLKPTTTEEH